MISTPILMDLLRAVLRKGALFRFKAPGSSMTPFIRDGDVVTIAPVKNYTYSPGTVVVFTRPGTQRLTVHRIIKNTQDQVYIAGDNCTGCMDGWVPIENVIGRVIRIDRNGHRIRLGLGIERYLIAWLSGSNRLHQLRNLIARLCHGRPSRTTE